jgi:hypothetical protein
MIIIAPFFIHLWMIDVLPPLHIPQHEANIQ